MRSFLIFLDFLNAYIVNILRDTEILNLKCRNILGEKALLRDDLQKYVFNIVKSGNTQN